MTKMNMFGTAMAVIAASVGFYYYASPYENCLRAKEITSAVRMVGSIQKLSKRNAPEARGGD